MVYTTISERLKWNMNDRKLEWMINVPLYFTDRFLTE